MIKQAAAFVAAFVIGVTGFGGHGSAVSLTQQDTERGGSVTTHGPHWAAAPPWVRQLAECVIRHESINAGHYRAVYPDPSVSSASGAYQFIDSTWRGNAKWVKGARKYARAMHAPPPYKTGCLSTPSLTVVLATGTARTVRAPDE